MLTDHAESGQVQMNALIENKNSNGQMSKVQNLQALLDENYSASVNIPSERESITDTLEKVNEINFGHLSDQASACCDKDISNDFSTTSSKKVVMISNSFRD